MNAICYHDLMKNIMVRKGIVLLPLLALGLTGCNGFFANPEYTPETMTGVVLEKTKKSDDTPMYVGTDVWMSVPDNKYLLEVDLNDDGISDRTISLPRETWDMYEVGSVYQQ